MIVGEIWEIQHLGTKKPSCAFKTVIYKIDIYWAQYTHAPLAGDSEGTIYNFLHLPEKYANRSMVSVYKSQNS